MKNAVRVLMIAEIEAETPSEAFEILDEFREDVMPSANYGIRLTRATVQELKMFSEAAACDVTPSFVPTQHVEVDEDKYDEPEEADADDEPELTEPEEEDLVTSDHVHFYSFGGPGKLAFTVGEDEDWKKAAKAHMGRVMFWPNLWWISDHGNAHLLNPYEK